MATNLRDKAELNSKKIEKLKTKNPSDLIEQFKDFLNCKKLSPLIPPNNLNKATQCFNDRLYSDLPDHDKASIAQFVYLNEILNVRTCSRKEEVELVAFHSFTPQFICFEYKSDKKSKLAVFFKTEKNASKVYTFFKFAPL